MRVTFHFVDGKRESATVEKTEKDFVKEINKARGRFVWFYGSRLINLDNVIEIIIED